VYNLTVLLFRSLLESDPLGLSDYVHTENDLRYVNCKFFADKFNLPEHSKKHPKEFLASLIRQVHAGNEAETMLIRGANRTQQRYLLFSWFVMIMIAAPAQKIPRTAEREAWIQHWLRGTVPNVSGRPADYAWNRVAGGPMQIPLTIITTEPLHSQDSPLPHVSRLPQILASPLPPPPLTSTPVRPPTAPGTPFCIRASPLPQRCASPLPPPPPTSTPVRPTSTPVRPPASSSPSPAPDSGNRSQGYNTKEKRLQRLLDDVGEKFLWRKLLSSLASQKTEENLRHGEIIKEIICELDKNASGARRKVMPLLVRILTGSTREASTVQIATTLLDGTAKDVLRTVKELYGNLICLPARRTTEFVRDNLRLQFIEKWGLKRICRMV
jgi:hypothetical protein